MESTPCPYCQHPVPGDTVARFLPCPSCGYKFARVGADSDRCLIIDSSLPNLMDRFQDLLKVERGQEILIDRRVGQAPIAGADRRR